jgi:RNA polymerase sigma-70 factor (ECF subfamily)
MAMSPIEALATPAENSWFKTTHWSVVLAADGSDTAKATEAMEKLCRIYWYPLYSYLRRRGCETHDAQDLTQQFFVHLLERHTLTRVDRTRGRFRSFLLASLNYFLADEQARARALKRGGGREILSIDAEQAEERYRLEPVDERSPEIIFEYRWAMTLLDQVLGRLAQEFSDAGKSDLFERLQPFLVAGDRTKPYAQIAAEAGLSEEAFKKAVQRMRKRYHELFREEIAQTVANQAEVDEELKHLSEVMAACRKSPI